MEYLKSIEHYLLEEIQKYLNLIEEETTDVTYRQIINKIIINYVDNEDIISFNKNNFKSIILDQDLNSFDFSKNNTKFILDQILETVKTIQKTLTNKIIDDPKKFFFDELKKQIIKDNLSKNIYSNKCNRFKINDNIKPSTIVCYGNRY